MSDYEFKAASRDGVGEDWPISYADLAPYYERVERYLGVYGTPEQLPQMPDGAFLEPPQLTPWELDLKAAIERRWGTRRLTSARFARRAPQAMLDAALRTGRLMLRPNSVASRVVTDPKTGRASGVAFVDAITGQELEVNGRVVVLCASAIESTRLLLNSSTTEHPQGLANSSGALGHYLMDHCCGVGFEGVAPRQSRTTGRVSNGGQIPAFRNITEQSTDFVRAYGVELGVRPPVNGQGRGWRRQLRSSGARFWSHAFGEVLPRFENQVSVDGSRTDAWGIPIAHIECSYGENEARMAADQLRCLEEILDAGGFQIGTANRNLAPPGTSVHEMGTARMGSDPSGSVLNRFNQSWDVKNLFVTDGASFTSGGFQNPTLTMMALTVRACDYIVDKLQRKEL
jgi:choline dehydrogenase-like flavoprotein